MSGGADVFAEVGAAGLGARGRTGGAAARRGALGDAAEAGAAVSAGAAEGEPRASCGALGSTVGVLLSTALIRTSWSPDGGASS